MEAERSRNKKNRIHSRTIRVKETAAVVSKGRNSHPGSNFWKPQWDFRNQVKFGRCFLCWRNSKRCPNFVSARVLTGQLLNAATLRRSFSFCFSVPGLWSAWEASNRTKEGETASYVSCISFFEEISDSDVADNKILKKQGLATSLNAGCRERNKLFFCWIAKSGPAQINYSVVKRMLEWLFTR